MDQPPLDGRLTDLNGFTRLGDAGVDLFMVDSTNAEVPGYTPHEREIAGARPDLRRGTAPDRRRLLRQPVHRVQQVLDVSAAHWRKVAFVGRSMVRNMGIARDLGYLRIPGGTLVDLKSIDDLAPGEVVLCRPDLGRADGGAVLHGEPRSPSHQHRTR